jgi:hypothetical protein
MQREMKTQKKIKTQRKIIKKNTQKTCLLKWELMKFVEIGRKNEKLGHRGFRDQEQCQKM